MHVNREHVHIFSVGYCTKHAVSNVKCHDLPYGDMIVINNVVYTVGHIEGVEFTVRNKHTETVTDP